jgi:hypothetical protein
MPMRALSTFEQLSCVIPIKNPLVLNEFITENEVLLKSRMHKIIVDSGGGSLFRDAHKLGFLPLIYEARNVPLWEARKLGYTYVVTPYVLNLDCDVVPPIQYVQDALDLLEKGICAVSIHFEPVYTGHLEFGVSMWKTGVLRSLYDYPPKPVEKLIKVGKQEWVTAFQCGFCECSYMWSRLINSGGRLETLPYRAKHLKQKLIR